MKANHFKLIPTALLLLIAVMMGQTVNAQENINANKSHRGGSRDVIVPCLPIGHGLTDNQNAWCEEESLSQTLQLAAGTNGTAGSNWVSFNTEINMTDLRSALVNAMPNNAIKIQSQDNNCSYNPRTHRWTGTLTALDLSQMYKIEVLINAEIVLEGNPVDPSQVPATLNVGNNWIAYPLAQNMTLTNAFASFAANGDKVQSQGSNANYNRNRWQGQLTTLEPGKGYVYVNGQTSVRTLVFPSAK